MEEEWRPVVGFEGTYEVSSMGRVRSLERRVPNGVETFRVVRERVLAYVEDAYGYPRVNLSRGNVQFNRKIHHLVAEAFINPRPPHAGSGTHPGIRKDDTNVLHNDGDKTNNRASNLRYGSQKANIADAKAHGTWKPPPVAGTPSWSGKRKG